MELESLDGCSLPSPQGLDLPDPPQYSPHCDCSKPVIVQTDASEYGLGAALLQSASQTLTDMETHYAKIERESVSVLCPQKVPHIPLWQACNHPK